MDEKEIEFLSLRERIRELEQRLSDKQVLLLQREQTILNLYKENADLKNQIDDAVNESKIFFGTRNQDGLTKEYCSIQEAVKDFAAYDGYRLDIVIENYPSIHVYRDELPNANENLPIEVISQMNCVDYDAKVVIYRNWEE